MAACGLLRRLEGEPDRNLVAAEWWGYDSSMIEHVFDPSRGPSRLEVARAALREAERRAGLSRPGSGVVGPLAAAGTGRGQAALARPLPVQPGDPAGSPAQGGPWEDLLGALEPGTGGVRALEGSTTLLLAAAARRQGQGWCAVVGGQDLGWCAGAESGLALERTLVVPLVAPDAERTRLLPTVLGSLIGAVEVVVLVGMADYLTDAVRRSARARARERGTLLLSDQRWPGTESLQAQPVVPQEAVGAGSWSWWDYWTGHLPQVEEASAQGADQWRQRAGLPLHLAQEMPAGYLQQVTWQVRDRCGRTTLLAHDERGVARWPRRSRTGSERAAPPLRVVPV